MTNFPYRQLHGWRRLVCLTTKEAGMFEDSEEAGHADNQQLGLNFIGGRMCISPFLTSGFWGRDHNESGPEVSKIDQP